MALESKNFNATKKHRLESSEFVVSCVVSAEEEISKIFSVSANAFVKSKEVLAGSINFNGEVETCLVYMSDKGEIGSVHTTCSFSSRFEDPAVSSNDNAFIRVQVLGYDVEEISGNNVSIKLNLRQSGFVAQSQEIRSAFTSDEDFTVKEDEMQIIKFVGENITRINSTGELSTREAIKKLILCESQASVKECQPGVNFVSVTVDVVSRVLYLTESDRFESAYVFDTVKEEIELEGITRESRVEANSFVIYSEVKASVENKESGANITLDVPVKVCIMAYDEETINVVFDLYSTKHETLVATDSFEMTYPAQMEILNSKIDGTLVIDDDKPRVDKILFTAGDFVNISNSFVKDGNLTVEGIAKTNVVYLNDETGENLSVELEIPFVINERVSLEDGDDIDVIAVLSDVDVSVKKGRELFYEAKIKLLIYSDENMISAVISNVSISDELPQKDYSLEIVFGKEGQSAWDIAKSKHIKEEVLISQNPEAIFPLSENTELVLFYQNTKNSKIS